MASSVVFIPNNAKVSHPVEPLERAYRPPKIGLYRGYKLRNARLDSLSETPPSYLCDSAVALANETFADVKSEETLHELHAYLSLKHALLDRVIRARRIHHTRFFSMSLDYGRKTEFK